jgi:hypothetical protein
MRPGVLVADGASRQTGHAFVGCAFAGRIGIDNQQQSGHQ